MTHTAAVQPIMDPDYDAMLQHLESLFGRAPDGMIEISWTDAKTKRLQHAQLFDVGDLDMAAEKAHEINGREFCNVYVGAALRKPGTFPGARAKDDDFHAAWALHVDLDDAGAPEAAKTAYQDARLTPPIAIVTGRHPHTRAQLWWPLDEPVTDPEQYRRILRALADGLHGDTTVCNPSRVMRLGGTVAWPVKEGRRTEKTELNFLRTNQLALSARISCEGDAQSFLWNHGRPRCKDGSANGFNVGFGNAKGGDVRFGIFINQASFGLEMDRLACDWVETVASDLAVNVRG